MTVDYDWDEDDGPTMDHAKAVRVQGALPYATRAQPYPLMDEAVMEEQGLLALAMGYGLDAPERIPAGSMQFYKLRPIMTVVARD